MRKRRQLNAAVALVFAAACTPQPRPATPRPVTAPYLMGDSTLVRVHSVPRQGVWTDDLTVQTPATAQVAIFDFSPRGKPRLRIVEGGDVQAVTSVHWFSRGSASKEKPPGYYGGGAGQSVCKTNVTVPLSPGATEVVPVLCTQYQARPNYAPTYNYEQFPSVRSALVVVADSSFVIPDRNRLLNWFVETRGNQFKLEWMVNSMAPGGRWAAVAHSPRVAW